MASTCVVSAHSRLRQADWDAGQVALGNSGQKVGGSEGSRARLRQGKMAQRQWELRAHREGERK